MAEKREYFKKKSSEKDEEIKSNFWKWLFTLYILRIDTIIRKRY